LQLAEFCEFACGIEAILGRHTDVHHDNVRRKRPDLLDSLKSIGGFAHDGEAFALK